MSWLSGYLKCCSLSLHGDRYRRSKAALSVISSDLYSWYEFLNCKLSWPFSFLVSFLVLNSLSFLWGSGLVFPSLESGDEPSKFCEQCVFYNEQYGRKYCPELLFIFHCYLRHWWEEGVLCTFSGSVCFHFSFSVLLLFLDLVQIQIVCLCCCLKMHELRLRAMFLWTTVCVAETYLCLRVTYYHVVARGWCATCAAGLAPWTVSRCRHPRCQLTAIGKRSRAETLDNKILLLYSYNT